MNKLKKTFLKIIFFGFACLFINTNVYSITLSIDGYDPVAYFIEQNAVQGKKEYEYELEGKRWLFSSEENKTLFIENPEKYTPQYDAYCAYAVSRGYLAKIDPRAWTVYQDKLYLNYSIGIKKQWDRRKDNFIIVGDKNWIRINPNNINQPLKYERNGKKYSL